MSIHAPTVTPVRLTNAATQRDAVEEINGMAAEITRGAGEIADKLRELADAIRDHTKVAHQHIRAFCDKASSLLEAIPALQRQLDGVDQLARFGELEKSKGLYALRALQTLERAENKPEVQGIREDIPAFLKKGPADFEDREL